jgi:hypothetical protein
MLLKELIDEDFVNYKEPAMFLAFPFCDFKCCIEQNMPTTICHNEHLAGRKNVKTTPEKIIKRFIQNPLTTAIVMGGLEPMLSFADILELISVLRNEYQDNSTVVIYTGYNEDEVEDMILELQQFDNIIIKFGRFIFNDSEHYDKVLGVRLSSSNQYARKIS